MEPVGAAFAADPVLTYDNALQKLRTNLRHTVPFSYCAYRSLIPNKDEDFIDLAYKISYYITFRILVAIWMQTVSPICGIIPYLPFCCDILWVGYRWLFAVKSEGNEFPVLTAMFYICLGVTMINSFSRIPNF